jgi:hypothetical protein
MYERHNFYFTINSAQKSTGNPGAPFRRSRLSQPRKSPPGQDVLYRNRNWTLTKPSLGLGLVRVFKPGLLRSHIEPQCIKHRHDELRGIIPNTAASAVRATGRARRTVASMIARCRPWPEAISRSIWPTTITVLRMIMPALRP